MKKQQAKEVFVLERDQLIQQVKSEYARLAELESRAHVTDKTYRSTSPEVYYERALEKAIRAISDGQYDDCVSGLQVVEQIANHTTKAQRIQNTIESTLHNMEITEELIAVEPDNKKAQDMAAKNERRMEAVPQMIREMKEELAQEELNADSPNVIGGGNG